MQNCEICNREMKEWGEGGLNHCQHLVLTKSGIDGHMHVHGDLDNKEVMSELLEMGRQEVGITNSINKINLKEVVFHNRQRIGDVLTFTSAIRDFKKAYPDVEVNVISTAAHIWDFNPHINRKIVPTEANTVKIGPGMLTNASNRIDWHMTNAFRISMEDKLKISIPQGESRPDIWLTQEEWDAPRLWEVPYWIICVSGEKGWGCKMYPIHKWQEVVDQNPDITFVQIGTAEDNPPRLKGKNVIDYVGKTQDRNTGIRELYKLFLNAEGSIGLVSFHMHLSGALYKPAVVVAGGREPVSFTRYPGHAYLSTDGTMPCAEKACWHCSIDACTNLVIREESREKKIPKCVDIIDSMDISRAIHSFYRGGLLSKNTPSEKPARFKNIVPTPPVSEEAKIMSSSVETYGFTFGGGSITQEDWAFMQWKIKENNVKTIIEFGAGLSTLLLNDLSGIKVVTYETMPGWIDRIKSIKPSCDIRRWDGQNLPSEEDFKLVDLVFVDGPAGDSNREFSTHLASLLGANIIVHDAGREWARKHQEEFIKPDFNGPEKGGHRCHFWKRKTTQETLPEKIHALTTNKIFLGSKQKIVKVVSTARGWGGCARSITTIMKFLLQAGHKVEFIPFRNQISSKEFCEKLNTELKDVKVTLEYNTLHEACDVLFMYADDYVWEFPKPEMEVIFSNIGATRKIMMLNYRQGKVGIVPWTKHWDKYMFLNKTQESELLKVFPEALGKTKVLPPCTDLTEFFKIRPNYSSTSEGAIRIVRHSSQGDTKFESTFPKEVEQILECRKDLTLHMLPGHSLVTESDRVRKVLRTADPKVIAQFLSTGNLFWYSLPVGYADMGPRVIIEAMACGLPILADNWGGASDRVTPESGWLLDDKNWCSVIQNLSSLELAEKGAAARERAYNEFRVENWVKEITL